MSYYYYNGSELYHYGVKGMKWGHRKAPDAVSVARGAYRNSAQQARSQYKAAKQQARAERKAAMSTPEAKAARAARAKKAAKIGAAAAGTALAAYGAYKLSKYIKTKNGQIAAQRGAESADRFFDAMQKSLSKDLSAGRVTSVNLRSNAASSARAAADRASNDSLRTAARNVMNYKRSGGNLSNLRAVSDYNELFDRVYQVRR